MHDSAFASNLKVLDANDYDREISVFSGFAATLPTFSQKFSKHFTQQA